MNLKVDGPFLNHDDDDDKAQLFGWYSFNRLMHLHDPIFLKAML